MSSTAQLRPFLTCFALLSFFWCSSVLRGEADIRRVSLHVVSMVPPEVEHLYIRSGEGWTSLHAPSSYVAGPVAYQGPVPLVVYLRSGGGEGEDVEHVPVASVEIPVGQDDVLLLLSRRDPEPFLDAVVVSLKPEGFPQGSFLFINQTAEMVVVKIDSDRMELATRESRHFTPTQREAGVRNVSFVYRGDAEQKSYVANTWFYRPAIRQLVLLVPEENSDRFEVRVINLRGNVAEE
jgi:hypothetical protein